MMNYIIVFLISMVPLIELRGSILYATGIGLPFLPAYITAIIGNMLPVPFIFLFARKILVWGADKPVIGRFSVFALRKARRAARSFRRRQAEVCLWRFYYSWAFRFREQVPGRELWQPVFWIWISSPVWWLLCAVYSWQVLSWEPQVRDFLARLAH